MNCRNDPATRTITSKSHTCVLLFREKKTIITETLVFRPKKKTETLVYYFTIVKYASEEQNLVT